MNILLFILTLLASSTTSVSAACAAPQAYTGSLPANLAIMGNMEFEKDGDDIYLTCPSSGQWFLKQSSTGAGLSSAAYIICNGDKWRTESGVTLEPLDEFACVVGNIDPENVCKIKFNGMNQDMIVGDKYKCQPGQMTSVTVAHWLDTEPATLTCYKPGTVFLGSMVLYYNNTATPRQLLMDCTDPTTMISTTTTTSTTTKATTPTTKTTSTTTTTAKPTTVVDRDPPSSVFWDLTYYYNYGRILHAFCSHSGCYDKIMKNGIGYDPTNYSGSLGKTINYSAETVATAKASCPIGYGTMKLLGFSRSGDAYVHNLDGQGLVMGWVTNTNGACGFKRPMKAWGCRYSADVMYGQNLETNTFYQGLVRHGGAVQFYLY